MQPYKNLSGQSGVIAYEIGEDFIDVKFRERSKDGCDTYKYSYFRPGSQHVEQMKRLALIGLGLNSYINKNVRKLYESKH